MNGTQFSKKKQMNQEKINVRKYMKYPGRKPKTNWQENGGEFNSDVALVAVSFRFFFN